MLTDKQIVNAIRTLFKNTDIPENGYILTNSHRVLAVISGLEMHDLNNVYYVTTNPEEATEIYTHILENSDKPFKNVYVATFDKFIKEFKKFFDCVIFDFDKISCNELDSVNNVITHGAKNNCITCVMSSCEGVDQETNEKINGLVHDVCYVYDKSIPLIDRLPAYFKTVHILSSMVPWHTDTNKMIKRFKNTEELILPPMFVSNVTDGETPYLGIRNYASFLLVVRYMATVSVRTQSFQIPINFIFIDDEKFSSGIVLVSRIHRNTSLVSFKSYQNKCYEIIKEEIPDFYTASGDLLPKKVAKDETIIDEKAVPISLKIGKSIEELASIISINAQLKKFLLNSLPEEKINEIFKEFNNWVKESGGEDKVGIEMMLKKLSEYDELKEFVELFKSDTIKEKTDL